MNLLIHPVRLPIAYMMTLISTKVFRIEQRPHLFSLFSTCKSCSLSRRVMSRIQKVAPHMRRNHVSHRCEFL